MSNQSLPLMARYNQWMNQRLYAACAGLDDARRKRDEGIFFRSIHNTLNHILLADRVWLGRLTGEPFAVTGLDQVLYDDFDELTAAREQTDRDLIDYVAGCDDDSLSQPFTYRNFAGEETTLPLLVVLTHVFNHQTHHRGQVTALLSQAGIDYGVTDLIRMPL